MSVSDGDKGVGRGVESVSGGVRKILECHLTLHVLDGQQFASRLCLIDPDIHIGILLCGQY